MYQQKVIRFEGLKYKYRKDSDYYVKYKKLLRKTPFLFFFFNLLKQIEKIKPTVDESFPKIAAYVHDLLT